ncbi:hypothetical protein BV20DRAFT_185513, partial [Pilatotrama ljubarskyi]
MKELALRCRVSLACILEDARHMIVYYVVFCAHFPLWSVRALALCITVFLDECIAFSVS